MDLPQDLKYTYIVFLEEEIQVVSKFNTKAALQYGKALENLRKYPASVTTSKQLLDIQFIGPKIVQRLDKRLEKYCKQNGYRMPNSEQDATVRSEATTAVPGPGTKRRGSNAAEEPMAEVPAPPPAKKRKTTERKYIPAKRSGGYAIILTLLKYDYRRNGMSKEEIIRHATDYCDQSFHANPSTNQFYSAWTSSKTLINKKLIIMKGRPALYYLSDDGIELASLLATNESVEEFQSAIRKSKERLLRTTPSSSAMTTPTRSRSSNKAVNTPLSHHNKDLKFFQKHGYSVWEKGEFDIELMIDNREVRSREQRDYFSKKLNQAGTKTTMAQLSVGDGVWIARHRNKPDSVAVLDFIMERKRLDDLASSIRDGRYNEQKQRLKRTGITNVYYIVEETTASDLKNMEDAIQTAIATNVTNSQFFTKRTKDSDDTVAILHSLTNKIKQFYQTRQLIVIERPIGLTTAQSYAEVLNLFRSNFQNDICYDFQVFKEALGKSDFVTVKETFVKMLMTIKGVSFDKAMSIQKIFPTPIYLLEAYRNCPNTKAKETLLSKLTEKEIGNKKIGPVLSKKIGNIWGI